jgi:TfoX/Sxy family transcriptional regulator of competence genes
VCSAYQDDWKSDLKAKYLNTVKNLLRQTHPGLENDHELTFKACFGAVAAYVDDNIFATCGEFGVALKLPTNTVDHLLSDENATLLKYSANGRIKKNYVVIPPHLLVDRDGLGDLVVQSVQYAVE